MSKESSKYENSILSPDVAPFFPKNYQQNVPEENETQPINSYNFQPPAPAESVGSYYTTVNYPYLQDNYNNSVFRDLSSWRTVPVAQYGMPFLQPTHFYQAPRGTHFPSSSCNDRHYNASRWYFPTFRHAKPFSNQEKDSEVHLKQKTTATDVTWDCSKKSSGGTVSKNYGGGKIQSKSSSKWNSGDTEQQRLHYQKTNQPEQHNQEQEKTLKTYQRTSGRKQRIRPHKGKETAFSNSIDKQGSSSFLSSNNIKNDSMTHERKNSFASNSSEFPSLSQAHSSVASETTCKNNSPSTSRLSYSEALKSEHKESVVMSDDKIVDKVDFINSNVKYDKKKKKHKHAIERDIKKSDDSKSSADSSSKKTSEVARTSQTSDKCRSSQDSKKRLTFSGENSAQDKVDSRFETTHSYIKENIPPDNKQSPFKAENTFASVTCGNIRQQCNSSNSKSRTNDFSTSDVQKSHKKKHANSEKAGERSTFSKKDKSSTSSFLSGAIRKEDPAAGTTGVNADDSKKKKKNRKSSRKRKALMQTGKVTVISSELHQVLMNHVSNLSAVASTSSQVVNISSSEEYPELGLTLPTKEKTNLLDDGTNLPKAKLEKIKDNSTASATSQPKISVWDFFKNSLYSDVLKKKQQLAWPSVNESSSGEFVKETSIEKSTKDSKKDSRNIAQSSQAQNTAKTRTKYTPRAPIDLDISDLLEALQVIKTTTQKKKKEAKLVIPDVKQVKKKAEFMPRNALDSSAPLKKRGKEREKPRKKRPSLMKKIILRERLERKHRHSRKLKPVGVVSNDPVEQSTDDLSEEVDTPTKTDDSTTVETSGACINVTQSVLQGPVDINLMSRAKEIVHTRHFREYCSQLLSDDIDETVKTLLEDLVRFQDRMFQKDPIKARMKRRLVFGLREVTKHLKLRKIKCIIVAPDVERIKTAGGLDDALQNILKIAAESSVPAIFALKRTQLGKLCKKSVPVSCIGVFNYEGTEDNYKTLLELTNAARKAYMEVLQYVQNHLVSCEDCRDANTTSATTLSHMPSCDTFLAQVNANHNGGSKDTAASSVDREDEEDDDDQWEEINEIEDEV